MTDAPPERGPEAARSTEVALRSELVPSVLAQRIPSWGSRPCIRTGFADLDTLTGGIRSGTLWVITGRSGAGKRVLVSDLARIAAVRNGTPPCCSLASRQKPGSCACLPLSGGCPCTT